MNRSDTLNQLNPGESAVVTDLSCTGTIRRRLLDLGLTPDTPVVCMGISPHGDPKAYLIRGAVIAIRSEDSSQISIIKKEAANGSFQ